FQDGAGPLCGAAHVACARGVAGCVQRARPGGRGAAGTDARSGGHSARGAFRHACAGSAGGTGAAAAALVVITGSDMAHSPNTLLINPTITSRHSARFPLALLNLAAALDRTGSSRIIDGNLDRDFVADTLRVLESER